jgi:hypothetical protein
MHIIQGIYMKNIHKIQTCLPPKYQGIKERVTHPHKQRKNEEGRVFSSLEVSPNIS